MIMDDKNLELYGYGIGNVFLYYIATSCFCKNAECSGEQYPHVKLRRTMSNLFIYLLENADKKIISDSELLEFVWDKNGLKGSQHRLWQVMDGLKKKLKNIGISEGFIYRVNNNGYMVNKNIIFPLYKSKLIP